ncbi:hypothetical protein ACFL42_05090, partial [Candidatus Omnitrophota bacterium]
QLLRQTLAETRQMTNEMGGADNLPENMERCQVIAQVLNRYTKLIGIIGMGNQHLEWEELSLDRGAQTNDKLTVGKLYESICRLERFLGYYGRRRVFADTGEIYEASLQSMEESDLNPDLQAEVSGLEWEAARANLPRIAVDSLMGTQGIVAGLESYLLSQKDFVRGQAEANPDERVWPEAEPLAGEPAVYAPKDLAGRRVRIAEEASPKREACETLTEKGMSLLVMLAKRLKVPAFVINPIGAQLTRGRVEEMVAELNKRMKASGAKRNYGEQYGGVENPYTVSIRLAAIHDMPGQLPTVTNVGMSPENIPHHIERVKRMIRSGCSKPADMSDAEWEAQVHDSARWTVYDSLRRFYQEYAMLLYPDIKRSWFDNLIQRFKDSLKLAGGQEIEHKIQLSGEQMERLAREYREMIEKHTSQEIPNSPEEQMRLIARAVRDGRAWTRTDAFRRGIGMDYMGDSAGPGVIMQIEALGNIKYPEAAVFQNGAGTLSGSGVARLNNFGELVGSWGRSVQGFDIVDGVVDPEDISTLEHAIPDAHRSLMMALTDIRDELNFWPEVEFTIQNGEVVMLQCRLAMFEEKKASLDKEFLQGRDPIGIGRARAGARGGFRGMIITEEALGDDPRRITGEFADRIRDEGLDGFILATRALVPEMAGILDRADVIGCFTVEGGAGQHTERNLENLGKVGVLGVEGLEIHRDTIRFGHHELTVGNIITVDADYARPRIYPGRIPLRGEAASPFSSEDGDRKAQGAVGSRRRRSPSGNGHPEVDPLWKLKDKRLDEVPAELKEGRLEGRFNALNMVFRRIRERHGGVTAAAADELRNDVLTPVKELLENMKPLLAVPQAREKVYDYFTRRPRIFNEILFELARPGSPIRKEARTLILDALPLCDISMVHAEAIAEVYQSKASTWEPSGGPYQGKNRDEALANNVFNPLEGHLGEVIIHRMY